jgi:hypothetical protein
MIQLQKNKNPVPETKSSLQTKRKSLKSKLQT